MTELTQEHVEIAAGPRCHLDGLHPDGCLALRYFLAWERNFKELRGASMKIDTAETSEHLEVYAPNRVRIDIDDPEDVVVRCRRKLRAEIGTAFGPDDNIVYEAHIFASGE